MKKEKFTAEQLFYKFRKEVLDKTGEDVPMNSFDIFCQNVKEWRYGKN